MVQAKKERYLLEEEEDTEEEVQKLGKTINVLAGKRRALK